MSEPAIIVEGLSKSYQIGRAEERFPTFRDAITRTLAAPFKHLKRLTGKNTPGDTFWALKDVSFEVQPGEVMGIIGRNGAGKSTLLKILSRISEPTNGRAILNGRVASLLEVGTGFHPELTGRENIYLNGSILGLKKNEIDRKFDDIVAFSEIEKFLDTPVKRYSSGMYVRLAFAVAAHMEPEILIVDEVLAVGDAEFQQKCLGKMKDVASGQGRTVLFVSHNLSAVQSLCARAVMFIKGHLVSDGSAVSVIGEYLSLLSKMSNVDIRDRIDRSGRGRSRVCGIEIRGGDGTTDILSIGRRAVLRVYVDHLFPGLTCYLAFRDHYDKVAALFTTQFQSPEDACRIENVSYFECTIDELLLGPGTYRLNVALMCNNEHEDRVETARVVQVEPGVVRGRPYPYPGEHGFACMPHRWDTCGPNVRV